ncbi:MAG: hypothetical protein M1827_007243 [Pycnora praestabilis]|nr:MAG: hypothetical protein M1827_007243 [Pycnora praestabilis]
MSSQKPTIIAVFEPLLDILRADGYHTVGVTLPSVGAEPPLMSFDADVLAVQMAVVDALDRDEDVVLALHYYGGIVGPEGLQGLGELERERRGKRGGVIRLVYLCAMLIPEKVDLITYIGGTPLSWWKVEGDYVYALEAVKDFLQ